MYVLPYNIINFDVNICYYSLGHLSQMNPRMNSNTIMRLKNLNVIIVVNSAFNFIAETAKNICAPIVTMTFIKEGLLLNIIDLK
jgi:hypothetical protein